MHCLCIIYVQECLINVGILNNLLISECFRTFVGILELKFLVCWQDDHNPHLELTLSARKKIASVLEHLNRKWGKSRIACGQLLLLPYSVQKENLINCQRWTQDSVLSVADVFKQIGSPSNFRLRFLLNLLTLFTVISIFISFVYFLIANNNAHTLSFKVLLALRWWGCIDRMPSTWAIAWKFWASKRSKQHWSSRCEWSPRFHSCACALRLAFMEIK